jgi:hypothetical protein
MSDNINNEADDVISSDIPKKASRKTSNRSVSDDVIGSNISVNIAENPVKDNDSRKVTVAIYSTKNVNWEGVGKVVSGYNIVSKAQAEKWLTRKHIRLATPEEVAQEFGL